MVGVEDPIDEDEVCRFPGGWSPSLMSGAGSSHGASRHEASHRGRGAQRLRVGGGAVIFSVISHSQRVLSHVTAGTDGPA